MTDKLIKDSEELKILRNSIVDWVLLESEMENNAGFTEPLLLFLEQLLEFGSSPQSIGMWSQDWFEAVKFFIYETFLYIVAALLKNRAYILLHEVLSSSYIKPHSSRYGKDQFGRVNLFLNISDFFQAVLAPPKQRLYSPTAELVKRQADRTDLPLNALIEADLVIFLKAITSRDFDWYPQMFFYANNSEFPFLIRASQRRYFRNLATVLDIPDSAAVKARAKHGYEESGVGKTSPFFMSSRSLWESLRIDSYDTV